MKKLFGIADRYLKECDWKDLALIKVCLCAVGVLIGLTVTDKRKKNAFLVSLAVFLSTYIPLMTGFIRFVIRDRKAEGDERDDCL